MRSVDSVQPVRLLLDTPIWIWSLIEPDRLGEEVRQALTSEGVEIWLSPLSVWEMMALIDEGRIRVDADAGAWVGEALRAAPLREAPLNHEVARRSHALGLEGVDPAGRLIAATAEVYDLTLVTADRRLAAAGKLRILANHE